MCEFHWDHISPFAEPTSGPPAQFQKSASCESPLRKTNGYQNHKLERK